MHLVFAFLISLKRCQCVACCVPVVVNRGQPRPTVLAHKWHPMTHGLNLQGAHAWCVLQCHHGNGVGYFKHLSWKSPNQIQGLKSQLQTEPTCAIHAWCFLLALLIELRRGWQEAISQVRKWLTRLSIATWQTHGNQSKYSSVNSSNGILQTWTIFGMCFTTSSFDNFAIRSLPTR